jgi:saccharopine dehydrogenase-like NADP-dependent oxidoreductase
MKITVIGAGAIGSAVARNLLEHDEVRQVQVCDARARALQELHSQVENPRLRSFQVDARDPNVLEPILRGADCTVGCTLPDLNPTLAELCLDLGINYCDLGGNDEIVKQQLALNERAAKKTLWIVPNCGLAPGLVNVLCLHGIEQFDEVEAARLRVGDVPLHPEPPFNFRISWSADKIIDDYTCPVYLIEDGEIHEAEPLSHHEQICFPEPFGQMEAFCTAGGLSTLTEDLAGHVRTLDHKTIRWNGHADQMRFLLELGFGERRNIDVRTHLTYRDVLVRRMRQRLGGEYRDAVLLRVLIQGIKDGVPRTLVYEMVDLYDEASHTSAMKRCTSIPTAAVAVLIASNGMPGGGAAPPEMVVPHTRFLEMVTEQGLNITSSWHDGHVEITEGC